MRLLVISYRDFFLAMSDLVLIKDAESKLFTGCQRKVKENEFFMDDNYS